MHLCSAYEAVEVVTSGNRVYLQAGAATPNVLIDALVGRAEKDPGNLKNIELCSLHTEGRADYVEPRFEGIFRLNAFFVGGNVRKAVQAGRADYLPVFLSEVPHLFRDGVLPLDVAFIHVSPPDQHGFCSLGVSVDVTLAAIDAATTVVAQINPHMPRTHGDGMIHTSMIDFAIEIDEPLPQLKVPECGAVEHAIGKAIAELIDDGATLQMGIGCIPDAVLQQLGNHKDLGIHTEMFTDGLIGLVEKGVVTGKYKKIHPHKIISGFVMGTQVTYDFVDDNPMCQLLDIAYVNDPRVIARNPKVTAINSAIEVDLTGQVCADSIGTKHFSGVGGQMDFIRGAARSEGGKPIIALPSTTRRGESRIVPNIKPGGGVVTTRAHVHYVVTEYGVANLHGKNERQRADALTAIAHPDHRESLAEAASVRGLTSTFAIG